MHASSSTSILLRKRPLIVKYTTCSHKTIQGWQMVDSERECSEKIAKIKMKSSQKTSEALDQFGKAQKMKAEAQKKNEEMMTNAASDLEKLERDMAKSRVLSPESQKRIN